MCPWKDLAARALAGQVRTCRRRLPDSVARALHLIGPIQAQTASSPFLALAARMPGVTLEEVSAAYDGHRIVRGSNIRDTVPTPRHRRTTPSSRWPSRSASTPCGDAP